MTTTEVLFTLKRPALTDLHPGRGNRVRFRLTRPIILGDRPPVYEYAPGTWGPPEADKLTAHDGGWHKPGDA